MMNSTDSWDYERAKKEQNHFHFLREYSNISLSSSWHIYIIHSKENMQSRNVNCLRKRSFPLFSVAVTPSRAHLVDSFSADPGSWSRASSDLTPDLQGKLSYT